MQTLRHTIGNFDIFSFNVFTCTCYPLHNISYDIRIYLKKDNRSSAPENQSLHDVRRDSEREVLDMLHILLLPSEQPTQYIGVSLRLCDQDAAFASSFITAVLCPSPWSLCLSLRLGPQYR